MQLILSSSVDPTRLDICNALKILIVAQWTETRSVQLSGNTALVPGGRVPALELADGRVLFDANAAALFLYLRHASYKQLSTEEKSILLEWLRWEATCDSDEQIMAKLEHCLEKRGYLIHPQAIFIDLIMVAWLYGLERANPDMVKRSKIHGWYTAKLQKSEIQAAIQQLNQWNSVEETRKLNTKVVLDPKPPGIRLPEDGKRNVLITSALPYVNNVPHLGNIIGCVLSADVFARYCRLRGYNTLYICGTDEYGTATETKALEEGVSCQELCDKYHKIHAEVYKWFDIDFDYFGRTTTPQHTKIAQDIFTTIHKNDLLTTETVQQLYSENHQRFLADRFVEGTCPNCGFTDARGDQCDGCGKLLNAIELINPRSKLDGSTPIIKSSEHMFLNLPVLQSQCESWAEEQSKKGFWTANGKNITFSWMKEGLKPRCITRDLKWGTPVPLDSMKGKVLYVWFDAPIGYLSITANYTPEWEKWWKNPKQVQLFQFMGKDNVPFHTVIFPCTLFATKQPYTMLHHLSTTEYLNYEGDKFSKSRGIGVFGNNVMESGIPVSVWRYYLLSNRPENSDSMFTWTDLGMRTNTELLTNLGNFINRTLKFLKAKYNSILPDYQLNDSDKQFQADITSYLQQYIKAMEEVHIRAGLSTVMALSARSNQYLQDNRLDNTLFEKDNKRCNTVMVVACNIIYILSALLYPFMPSTTVAINKQLNVPMRTIPDQFNELDLLPGHRTGTPDHLFKRIDEKILEELFMRYGGAQILKKRQEQEAERKKREEEKKKAQKAAAKK